jgi:hypothetical protein
MWKDILKNRVTPVRVFGDEQNIAIDRTDPYEVSTNEFETTSYKERCDNAKKELIKIMESMLEGAFVPMGASSSIDDEIKLINNMDCKRFKLYLDKLTLSLSGNNNVSEEAKNKIRAAQATMVM